MSTLDHETSMDAGPFLHLLAPPHPNKLQIPHFLLLLLVLTQEAPPGSGDRHVLRHTIQRHSWVHYHTTYLPLSVDLSITLLEAIHQDTLLFV